MPTQSVVNYATNPQGTRYAKYSLQRGWQHSPRVNGKLVLQSLPYSKVTKEVYAYYDSTGGNVPSGPTGFPSDNSASAEARNRAYASFRSRLYQGSAALGVSLGSYKQSREMIVARANTINRGATKLYEKAMTSKKSHTEVSGLILEGLFGWKPLLQDIHAAASSVIQLAPAGGKVSGSGEAFCEERLSTGNSSFTSTVTKRGRIKIRHVANYRVTNPNTFLADRAGLLNPAAVAWDLVPWSFVVNMFSNTGQLVNSITDFAGLDFWAQSTSSVREYSETRSFIYFPSGSWGGASGALSGFERDQKRSVGVPLPPPTLQLKIPEANWELAAIACSLMTQKISRLGNVLRKIDTKLYTE